MNQAATKRRVARMIRDAKTYPIERLASQPAENRAFYDKQLSAKREVAALSAIKNHAWGYLSNLGAYHVLNDETEKGWQELEQQFYLEALTTYAIGAQTAKSCGDLLLASIAFGNDELAQWMSGLLQTRLAQGITESNWDKRSVPCFAAWLFGRWSKNGDTPTVTGVYQPVVAAWADEAALAEALDAACEFHVAQVLDHDLGVELLSFRAAPFELAAVRAVRQREGLAMPTVGHPLANSTLANIPLGPTGYDPASDSWVQLAMDAAKPAGRLPASWQPQRRV